MIKNQSEMMRKDHAARAIVSVAGIVVFAMFCLMVQLGHQKWNEQTTLTAAFESCMEIAPFKSSQQSISSKTTLNAENLQAHYDEFNHLFDATGLPPIWDGQKLVAWKEYHQESIKIAEQCHQSLRITDPQKELRGSYSKPVWDPGSEIWQTR